jgi:RHS repeat-associated protein
MDIRRRTSRSIVVVFLLSGTVAYGLPAQFASRATADTTTSPGEAPPPISDAERQPVDATVDQPTAKVTPDIPDGDTPAEIVDDQTEIPSQETSTASAYRDSDGGHLLDITPTAQNFQAPSGTWQDIDTTLVATDGGYRSAAGPTQLFLPDPLSASSPIRLTLPQGTLAVLPLGPSGGAGSPEAHPAVDGSIAEYADAFPGVDLNYQSIPGGYKEGVVLTTQPAGDRFAWDVTTTGLSLRLEAAGQISLLAGTQVIATFPPPMVYDSNVDPETGVGVRSDNFSYALADLGGGHYRIDTLFDQPYLADPARAYPVTIDPSPIQSTLTSTSDTDVSSCDPNTNFSSDIYVRTGGSCSRNTFIHFNVASYKKGGRITYQGQLQLDKSNSGGDATGVRRPTADWTATTLTWNTQPTVGATVWASTTGGAGNWQMWEIGNLYQKLLDGTMADNGIRLSSGNYNEYTSHNYSGDAFAPHLFLVYNDLPAATTLSYPSDNVTINVQSPALAVTAMPTDPNTDDTWVQFQVSDDGTNWTGTHLVDSSLWLDAKSWSVDAGSLKDGQTYWWRAVSGDVCGGGLCNNVDAAGTVHDRAVSAKRKFTVNLPHYGTDDRWALWSDALGNGISLDVNEANGNLYLDYPLDALQTPVGPLAVGLTYNSQLPDDLGLSPGWNIAAGPLSDGTKLPISLMKLDPTVGDGVMIKFEDGDRVHIPHLAGDLYEGVGAGAGVVTSNPGATGSQAAWTYTTDSGGRYTFDSSGKLLSAKPSSDDWAKAGFDYSYDASFHLQWVKDPLGRQVTFTWTGTPAKLTSIKAWDTGSNGQQRTWTLAYDTSGRLQQITDPLSETVALTYEPTWAKLAGIQDGQMVWDGRTEKTAIAYVQRSTGIVVDRITAPGAPTPHPTNFSYAGALNGSIVATTTVNDPLATSGGTDHRVWTDFNTVGLPIRVFGPYDENGVGGLARMVWDTNGNLVCSRSPLATAAAGEKCVKTDSVGYDQLGDPLNTDYAYQDKPPYKVLSVTGPTPNTTGTPPGATGTGTRALTTYRYDEGFTGLANQQFNNAQLAGMPAYESISSTINFDWSSTGKPANLSGTSHWSIRWTGTITAPTSGKYLFRLKSDDGARLVIDHLFAVDCWSDPHSFQSNCGGPDAAKYLSGGKPVPITVEYYHGLNENNSNPPRVELWWDKGNGTWQIVPATSGSTTVLAPNLNLLTSEQDNAGTTTRSYPAIDDKVKALPASQSRGERSTSYLYDSYGRITSQLTAGIPSATTFHFTDAPQNDPLNSCMDTRTDPTGAITNYVCDDTGDVTRVRQTIRGLTGTYATQALQVRVVDTAYDDLGRVTSVSVPYLEGSPANRFTTKVYDKAGRLASVTDPLGFVTIYTYDLQGRLITKTDPDPDGTGPLLAPVTQHGYDDADNEISTTDARNHVWTRGYDALHRVISATDPVTPTPNISTSAYDLVGRTATVTDSAGVSTTTTFDVLGRKVAERLGALPSATYAYDPLGNVVQACDPSGVCVQKTYTIWNDPWTETRPTGNNPPGAAAVTTYTYDQIGRVWKLQDARGNVTTYGYDDDSRLTSAALPPPAGQTGSLGTTTMVYDDAGERFQMTGGSGVVRTFTYDEAGRQASVSDAKGTTAFKYDYDSRLTKVTPPTATPALPTQNFSYDNLGRRTRRWGNTGQTLDDERFSFDQVGNLTAAWPAANLSAKVTLVYDEANRVSSVAQGSSSTTYVYTKSQLTSRTDPAGTTSFTYRVGDGLPNTQTDPFTGQAVTYGYDASGRQQTRSDAADGVLTTRAYETASGRLDSQTTAKGSTVLASFDLGYDLNGNVTSKTQTVQGYGASDNGGWTYHYDEASRMDWAKDPANTTTTYGYDGAGNRTSVKVGSATPVITNYDSAGFPSTETTSGATTATYSVDPLGETTGITRGTSVNSFAYDTWGRLGHATTTSPTPADLTYAYDALDRTLTRARVGVPTTTYAWMGTSEQPASITTGTTTTKYAFTPGGPLAQQQGSTVRFFVSDLHQDVVGLVDKASGSVVGQTAFDPWGKKRATTGEQGTLGFQGDMTDADSGLVDMTTRLYDPNLGRFNTRDVLFGDPANPLSLNQFTYASANPVSLNDPTGMYQDTPNKCAPSCGSHGCTDANCDIDPHPNWKPAPDYFLHSPTGTNTWVPTLPARLVAHMIYVTRRTGEILTQQCRNTGSCPDPNDHGKWWAGVIFGGLVLAPAGALALTAAGVGGGAVLTGAALADAAVTVTNVVEDTGGAPAEDPVRSILAEHVQAAVDRLASEGLTPGQSDAVARGANAARYVGNRIDIWSKASAAEDGRLTTLIVTRSGEYGPDFYDLATGRWYDITTSGQWAAHLAQYGPDFGRDGQGIFYR